jgi:hypothetical protein
MSDDRSTVRAIAWREVFPWLRLLQVFRLAIRPRILLVAIVAALFCTVGWTCIGLMFRGSEDPRVAVAVVVDGNTERVPGTTARLYTRYLWESVDDDIPLITGRTPSPGVNDTNLGMSTVAVQGPNAGVAITGPTLFSSFITARPVRQLIGFGQVFEPNASKALTAFLMLCLLWAVVVWAFAGGIITRIAAVAFARGEQISWNRANLFAWRKWPSFFASPMLPLLGVVMIALVLAFFGLIMRIPYVGVPLIALGWPLLLVGGLLMTILLLGLIVGWPLMWCTISCEGTDSFDALGRSYGYVFGKPLQYLGYAAVALVLGWLGFEVVQIFCDWIVLTTEWAVSWGSTSELMRQVTKVLPHAIETPEGYTVADSGMAKLINFFNGCIQSIPVAFLYSFFWCAAMMIYLLVRRDEDQTEIDEVYLEEEQETYGLPPLRTDSAGVSEPADVPKTSAATTPPITTPPVVSPAPSAEKPADVKPPATNDSGPLPLE